jgi:C-terminal processing protease CtpA/Prc
MKLNSVVVLIFCCLLSISVAAQLNLDFEQFNTDGSLVKWKVKTTPNFINGYSSVADSVTKHAGRYSLMLTSTDERKEGTFGARASNIPAEYIGKQITFSGYIKTADVDGFAGLWMRIDDADGKLVSFNNMSDQQISGTREWSEYNFTIDLAPTGKKIVYGILLAGTGTMWVDDLSISIDGKPLSMAAKKEMLQAPVVDERAFQKQTAFEPETVNSEQAKQLAVLARVWGFLKYYHPAVAAGKFNWDDELLRILPVYYAEASMAGRNKVLKDWLDKLGTVATCTQCKDEIPANAVLKPDLDWLKDKTVFTGEVAGMLEHIRKNRHQGVSYYIDMAKGVGNPVIKNEKDYAVMTNPDGGYRMLSLFRCWNLIQYWFPYRHQVEGGNWGKELEAFIPVFAAAKDSISYRLAALRLIARIGDTHANIWGMEKILSEYKGNYAAPYAVRFIEGKAVITGSYSDSFTTGSGIAKGDIIEKVNGKKVEDIVKDMLPFTPASNYPTQLRDIAANLLRSVNKSIEVELNQNGEQKKYSITCHSRNKLNRQRDWDHSYVSDTSYTMLPGNIGYVTLGKIKNSQWENIFKIFKDTKGLIIDIRNYPSEFVVFTAPMFLHSEPTPFVKFTHGHMDYPGLFTIGQTPLKTGTKSSKAYKGKLVILINEISQSQAEYTAMALRTTPGAVVIGSTTAGADGNVSRFTLPGGIASMFSGIGIYYPDGKETQRIGIVPDVEIKPTIKGIKEGRDELMEKAIEVITAAK